MSTDDPRNGVSPRSRPVRLAIMDDYEVVVTGLGQMLAAFPDRVQVVELVSMLPVESDVDVLLYDGYSRERVTGPVEEVLATTQARFVLYSWNLAEEVVAEARSKGVAACLSKAMSAEELVDAIERVAGGETLVSENPPGDAPLTQPDWPGRGAGLSARESEVIALIAQGLTNQEIADRAYLSINTVKTFIRSAYRKIGVERRTQALLWASEHGFVPAPARTVYEAEEEYS